jgi:NADH:ubiquinone oxidoreductase subunit 6 (subunit J)
MTEKKLKYVQWLLYGIMAISAILTLLFYLNPGQPDLMLYWGYVLVIFSIVVTLTISFTNIIKNPKGSMKVVVIVAIMLILGFISYAISDNTLSTDQLEKYSLTPNGVRMVGAGLIMTYFIMIGAIGVFIYTSLIKFLK